jgi:threonine dehydratase
VFDASPTYSDVVAAADTLAGRAVVTPLLESPLLNERIGGRLLLKAECLQRTGSFKFRGAFNRLSGIGEADYGKGVVAFSSGNHAQGVASAAQILGMSSVIVMPSDAPQAKIDNTRAYGAETVFFDREREDREVIARRLATERRAILVPPFDDPAIIAGQGTVGRELAAQAKTMGAALDTVLVPCGGGGLIAGIAIALAHDTPNTAVYSVEPSGFDDTARSLVAGERQSVVPGSHSLCDALLVATPGIQTFVINKKLLAGGFVVEDKATLDAMAAAFSEFKLVVEPGGAVALAAVLDPSFDAKGKTISVVVSGGNVDAAIFKAALDRAAGVRFPE